MDVDNTYGLVAGMKAINIGMPIAQAQGVSAVAVRNSSHHGATASFALKAARNGFIPFAFTHADSLLSSHSGEWSYFGTNPLCVASSKGGFRTFLPGHGHYHDIL